MFNHSRSGRTGFVALLGAKPDQLNAIDCGMHRGIEKSGLKEAIRCKVIQRVKLVIDVQKQVFILQNLGVLVGAGIQARLKIAETGAVGPNGHLQRTDPDQHHHNCSGSSPDRPFDGVAAAEFLGGLRLGEQIDANWHKLIYKAAAAVPTAMVSCGPICSISEACAGGSANCRLLTGLHDLQGTAISVSNVFMMNSDRAEPPET